MTDSKYHVGDKVLIRDDLVHREWYGGNTFQGEDGEEMCEFLGKVVTIRSVKRVSSINGVYSSYRIIEDDCGWNFTDEMIKGLEVKEKPCKFMTNP